MRKAFLFYRSFYEAVKELEAESKAKLYEAICKYGFDGIEPEGLSTELKSVFILIKAKIDDCNTKRNNGLNGGRPKSDFKKYF